MFRFFNANGTEEMYCVREMRLFLGTIYFNDQLGAPETFETRILYEQNVTPIIKLYTSLLNLDSISICASA